MRVTVTTWSTAVFENLWSLLSTCVIEIAAAVRCFTVTLSPVVDPKGPLIDRWLALTIPSRSDTFSMDLGRF